MLVTVYLKGSNHYEGFLVDVLLLTVMLMKNFVGYVNLSR